MGVNRYVIGGDGTPPLTRDGHGCPKLNAQSFARMLKVSHAKPLHDATALMADEARMRNRQSVHMARMWCGARDSAVLEWSVKHHHL